MKSKTYVLLIIFMTALLISETAKAQDKMLVNSYYGDYDASQKKKGLPSAGLKGPVLEAWKKPIPKKPYHMAVLFPHLKDSFWITANYGIMSYAEKSGVKITLHEAGGYINFGNQRVQLDILSKKQRDRWNYSGFCGLFQNGSVC